MADDNDQLPEGTDKIIPGASRTGSEQSDRTLTTDTTLVTEKQILAPKPDVEAAWTGTGRRNSSEARPDSPASNSASGGKSGQPIGQKLRDGTEKLSGQAADKARNLVGQGLERSSEALSNVSRMIGDTATGIDDRLGSEYGDYARRAASAIDNAANSLASKNAEELIDDTRDFVRKSPGVALAGAAVVGFAIARLLKSSIGAAHDSRGGSDQSNRGNG